MDFKQIEAFLYVYKFNSFSRAAEVLFLTQPTVSAHISSLETELGVKLFDRSSKEVQPTEAGKIFWDYARGMIAAREGALLSLKEYTRQTKGRVEIAVSTIPGQYLLPGVIRDFAKKYPEVSFSISQMDSKAVLELLQDKKIELGITGFREQSERMEYSYLTSDSLVLVTPDLPKYAGWEDEVDLDFLKEEVFLLRETGSGTRQEFAKALQKKGIDLNTFKVIARLNSSEAIIRSVCEGLGISVVSSLSAADYQAMGKIRVFKIKGLELKRSFYLVKLRNRPLSPLTALFGEYVLRYFTGEAG